jgi:acyl CoA:acetate/3-ketoacid CoA transferase alpha subunit
MAHVSGTARNFNPPMATAAKVTIAEVEEIVPAGNIKPEDVHVPGTISLSISVCVSTCAFMCMP